MRRRLLGGAAITAFVAAVVVVVLPNSPEFVEHYGDILSGSILLGLLAVGLSAVGVRYGRRTVVRRTDEPPFDQPPEEAIAHEGRLAGGDIDDRYERLVDREIDSANRYDYAVETLQSGLQATAIEAVADAEDVSRTTARVQVAEGDWTDDVRARSFLGSPERPLSMRVRDWASGRGIERQVQATIEEIERIAAVPEAHQPRSEDATSRGEVATRDGGESGPLSLTGQSRRVKTTVTTDDTETDTDSHWEVGAAVAVLLGGLGFVLTNVALVLAAIVPAALAVYGSLTRPPDLAVDIERTVADESPVPGESVQVSLTVTNVGERPVAELRAIDGVPDTLRVVAGSPRLCVSLEPEESATATYTIEALRGEHAFESASLWARNVSGSVERSVDAELVTTVRCRDTVETMPTTAQTTPYQGRIETDASGAGLEFFATREYQANDPLSRIDWNHWARTGDPQTVEFRETRTGAVVIVLDDRRISRCARDEVTPDAVTLGRHAAVRMANTLLDDTNAVGGALLNRRRYERPGRGRDQRRRLRTFFVQATQSTASETSAESDSGSSSSLEDIDRTFFSTNRFDWVRSESQSVDPTLFARDGGGIPTEWLRKRLPGHAQIVFVSPLLDDAPRRFLRRLQADGVDVTVLSPNVTSRASPGGTAKRIERHERIRELRRRQCRVIDWEIDTPLSVALERAEHRWSR